MKLLAAVTGVAMAPLASHAATLYWDADASAANNTTPSTTQGGSNTWNNTLTTWYDGTNDVVWASGSVASFGGTAGTVTITSSTVMTTSGLDFATSGYTIKGGNAAAKVSFVSGATSGITVSGSTIATISAVFDTSASATTQINKVGTGTLVLTGGSNSSTGSGTFNLVEGIVAITANGNTVGLSATTINIGDGTNAVTIDSSGGTSSVALTGTVNFGVGGVWLRSSSNDSMGNIGRLNGQTINGGLLLFNLTATTTVSGTNSITSGITFNNGGNRDHHFLFLNASDSLDLGGVLTNTGTGSFTDIVGPVGSTMTYSGSSSNAFMRNTTVTGATLLLAKTGSAEALNGSNSGIATVNGGGKIKLIGRGEQIGETGSFNLALGGSGGTTVTGGTLDLNTFTETVDRISALSGNGVVTSSGGGGKLIFSSTVASSVLTATSTGNEINVGEFQLTNLASRNGGAVDPTRRFSVTGASDTLLISSTISNYAGINGETTFSLNTLEKAGAGTLTLTGTNTYVGLTNITAGTLSVNQDRALGADPTSSATNISLGGGTLQASATFTLHGNRNISMSAGNFDVVPGATMSYGGVMSESNGNGVNVRKTGAGELAITGSSNVYAGATSIAGGTLSVTSLVNSDAVALAATSGAGSALLTVSSTAGLTVGMNVGGSGKIPVGVTIAGIDSANNVVTLSGGAGVAAGTTVTTQFGSSSSLGYGAAADASKLVLDGGSLKYAGTTAGNSNRNYTLTANGGGYDASGVGGSATMTITGAMTVTPTTGSQTFTLSGSNTGNNTMAGAIVNGGGSNSTALSKSGAGQWILTGTNTYSGGTNITGGTLLANNATNSTGAGAVTIQTGGTLGGTGQVNGAVTVQNNGTLLAGDGTATTLTLASDLTMNTGSTLEIALGAAGVHSTLARTGGAWNFSPTQNVFLLELTTLSGTETYDNVVTGLAADPGTLANWHITNNDISGTFTYDGSGGIDLALSPVPEPGSLAAFGVIALGTLRRRVRKERK